MERDEFAETAPGELITRKHVSSPGVPFEPGSERAQLLEHRREQETDVERRQR